MEKKTYKQLTLEERIEIYRLHEDGKSCRFIANQTGRSPGTVSRELRRNSKPSRHDPDGLYEPVRAERRAYLRRHRPRGFLLDKNPDLCRLIRDALINDKFSPEQISGRLRIICGHHVISYEAIYRYVYHRWQSSKDPLYRSLPQGRVRRRPYRPRVSNLCAIQGRVSIINRPADVMNRKIPGHWEADLIQFSTYGQSVVVHERSSRFSCLLPQERKTAAAVASTLFSFFSELPPVMRQTLTFDNGSEFYEHYKIREALNISTYFCDPHAPWQKGGVEHAIRRFRRDLPRTTNPATLTPDILKDISDRHNRTPRKCLGFLTPAEIFFNYKPVALTS